MTYVSLHETMRQALFYAKEFAENNVANVKRVRMNTCPIEIDLKDGNTQFFMSGPVFEKWECGRHNYELGQAKTTRNEDVLTVCFDKHPDGRDKTILMVTRRQKDGFFVEKVFKNEKAEKMYQALLGLIEI